MRAPSRDGVLRLPRLRRQLEVDLLEAGPAHGELLEPLAAREGGRRRVVQQRRRVFRLALDQLVADPVAHAVARGSGDQLAGRALGEDPAVLDDRHAVGERLRLVEIVGGEQHGLPELAQGAHHLPGGAARGRVEARRRLVEEDQLGGAEEREGEVEPALLAAGRGPSAAVRALLEPGEGDRLLHAARGGVQLRPVLERLAHGQVRVGAAALQHDAHAPAQIGRALGRVEAEHGHLAAVPVPVALEDLDGGGLARAVGPEQPEDLAAPDAERQPADRLLAPVGLRQVVHNDRGARRHASHHGNLPADSMVCGCIDIGWNTTRVLVADTSGGQLRELLQRRAFTRIGKGLKPGAAIPREKIEEVAGVVASHRALAEQAGAHPVRTVATAAIRGAANRDEFVEVVSERGGVEVVILEGEEEARLAFLGATRTLGRALDGVVGVVDVGGGSTEIAVGTVETGVKWWASFPLGSGQLADEYLRTDPPAAADLLAMTAHAAGVFGEHDVPRPDAAVAVGGSAASLRRLVGPVLEPESMQRALR